jgi:hypothetical protein
LMQHDGPNESPHTTALHALLHMRLRFQAGATTKLSAAVPSKGQVCSAAL